MVCCRDHLLRAVEGCLAAGQSTLSACAWFCSAGLYARHGPSRIFDGRSGNYVVFHSLCVRSLCRESMVACAAQISAGPLAWDHKLLHLSSPSECWTGIHFAHPARTTILAAARSGCGRLWCITRYRENGLYFYRARRKSSGSAESAEGDGPGVRA